MCSQRSTSAFAPAAFAVFAVFAVLTVGAAVATPPRAPAGPGPGATGPAPGRTGGVVAAPAHPNPARFFFKIGGRDGKSDFWAGATEATKNKVARWSDLVIVAEPLAEAIAMKADAQSRNPALTALRYWNMWVAFDNTGGEVQYTDSMLVFENWPETRAPGRGRRIVNTALGQCEFELLDWGRPALQTEVGRAIANFIPDFDGVFFDNSTWDQFQQGYDNNIEGRTDGTTCEISPFSTADSYTINFMPAAPGFAVQYMKHMQKVIDPQGNGSKLQFCNAIPREAEHRDPMRQSQYLAILDGCQMDNAFVNGKQFFRYDDADWEFQIATAKKWVANGKTFLMKVPWSFMEEPFKTDFLEYSFGSYLLITDGNRAMFSVAYGFAAFDTDPIVGAPLGDALGDYLAVPGSNQTWHTYVRKFDNGAVYVNGSSAPRTVSFPRRYRDSRRGTLVNGSFTIPPASARILIKA